MEQVRPAGPGGNISHVETFDQFGETIHFGTLIKLVGLPSFTHLSITTRKRLRLRRKCHKYSFKQRIRCLAIT